MRVLGIDPGSNRRRVSGSWNAAREARFGHVGHGVLRPPRGRYPCPVASGVPSLQHGCRIRDRRGARSRLRPRSSSVFMAANARSVAGAGSGTRRAMLAALGGSGIPVSELAAREHQEGRWWAPAGRRRPQVQAMVSRMLSSSRTSVPRERCRRRVGRGHLVRLTPGRLLRRSVRGVSGSRAPFAALRSLGAVQRQACPMIAWVEGVFAETRLADAGRGRCEAASDTSCSILAHHLLPAPGSRARRSPCTSQTVAPRRLRCFSTASRLVTSERGRLRAAASGQPRRVRKSGADDSVRALRPRICLVAALRRTTSRCCVLTGVPGVGQQDGRAHNRGAPGSRCRARFRGRWRLPAAAVAPGGGDDDRRDALQDQVAVCALLNLGYPRRHRPRAR